MVGHIPGDTGGLTNLLSAREQRCGLPQALKEFADHILAPLLGETAGLDVDRSCVRTDAKQLKGVCGKGKDPAFG
jgi:hypothetical protein